MSGFSNPIIGGGGGLVYPSIHSPNFVTGVSGWTIRKDGSVEFNVGVFRGSLSAGTTIINSSGAFFYNIFPGAGTLLVSIAPFAGSDSFGNAYPAGVTLFQSVADLYVQLTNGAVNFNSTLPATKIVAPGEVFMTDTTVITAGASLTVQSPQAGVPATFQLTSTSSDGTTVLKFGLLGQPVYIKDSVAPNAVTPGGAGLYSSGGNLKYLGTDTNQYNTGTVTKVSGSQTFTLVTAVAISGLSVPVVANTYRFRAVIIFLANQSAGIPEFSVTGPATSGTLLVGFNFNGGTVTPVFKTAALATLTAGLTMVTATTYQTVIEGIVTFTASGNLVINAASSIAADTFTVQAGSHLELTPIS